MNQRLGEECRRGGGREGGKEGRKEGRKEGSKEEEGVCAWFIKRFWSGRG